jgi:hypothetical protein
VLLAEHLEPACCPTRSARWSMRACPTSSTSAPPTPSHRGFGLRRNADGSGWHITDGDLDLETGELLHTAIEAGLAVDPDNPTDTAEYAKLREQGWRSGDPTPDPDGPRSLRQRRHDALSSCCAGCSTAAPSAPGTRSRRTSPSPSGSTPSTASRARCRPSQPPEPGCP